MRTPIMEQVMADDSLIAAQPYFLHFVLDALDAAGLFEKYGLAQDTSVDTAGGRSFQAA